MAQAICLSIKMFGAFRKYHEGLLHLNVPADSPVSAVKTAIADALRQHSPAFNDDALIDTSVLADQQRVLGNAERIAHATTLAILPPVCGG